MRRWEQTAFKEAKRKKITRENFQLSFIEYAMLYITQLSFTVMPGKYLLYTLKL